MDTQSQFYLHAESSMEFMCGQLPKQSLSTSQINLAQVNVPKPQLTDNWESVLSLIYV